MTVLYDEFATGRPCANSPLVDFVVNKKQTGVRRPQPRKAQIGAKHESVLSITQSVKYHLEAVCIGESGVAATVGNEDPVRIVVLSDDSDVQRIV